MKSKTKQIGKQITTEEFDAKFDAGESVIPHLKLSSRVASEGTAAAPERVKVDFAQWVVSQLDRESDRLGITRQSLIKVWIAERLEKAAV